MHWCKWDVDVQHLDKYVKQCSELDCIRLKQSGVFVKVLCVEAEV